MWRRRRAAFIRKSLKHGNKRPRATRRIGNPIATLIWLAVTISSLWIAAELIGVEIRGSHVPPELSIELDVVRADDGDETYMGRVSKNKLFLSFELGSFLQTQLFENAEQKSGPVIASIHIAFFEDNSFRQVAKRIPDEKSKLTFLIYANREIVTKAAAPPAKPEDYKITRRPDLDRKDEHPFAGTIRERPKLAYVFESDFFRFASPGTTLETWIRLPFVKPLDAKKGLAQIEWRQTVQVVFGYYAAHRTASRISFDRDFEDVRINSVSGLEAPALTRTGFPSAHLTSVEGMNTFGAFQPGKAQPPIELDVHATSSRRKDLLDVIVFGLAALFGAALAATIDCFSKLFSAESRA